MNRRECLPVGWCLMLKKNIFYSRLVKYVFLKINRTYLEVKNSILGQVFLRLRPLNMATVLVGKFGRSYRTTFTNARHIILRILIDLVPLPWERYVL